MRRGGKALDSGVTFTVIYEGVRDSGAGRVYMLRAFEGLTTRRRVGV